MTSTSTKSAETSNRRLYGGLWAISGISLGGLIAVGYPVVGVGAFVACAVGALAVYYRYDGTLFDERDEQRQAAASERTLGIVGVSSAVFFPTVTALWGLGVVEWPVWLTPIALFVAALTFVHLGSTMYEATSGA